MYMVTSTFRNPYVNYNPSIFLFSLAIQFNESKTFKFTSLQLQESQRVVAQQMKQVEM